MRVHRLAVVTTVCVAAFVGCGGGDDDDDVASYCYSTDDSGVVLDSVRPEPGYVCVSTLIAETTLEIDSVRPEPGVAAGNAQMRTGNGRIKLDVMKKELLKRP